MEDPQKELPLVIVVDDEPRILVAVGRVLRVLPLRMETFGDPAKALERCESARPAILISDYRMPGMDGLELCKRIHQRYPDVRLVIHTGTPPPAPPYVRILAKPASNEELRQVVTSLLW